GENGGDAHKYLLGVPVARALCLVLGARRRTRSSGGWTENRFIDGGNFPHPALGVETLNEIAAAGLAHFGMGSAVVQGVLEGIREIFRGRFGQPARFPMAYYFRETAKIRGENGARVPPGFQDDHSERLPPYRGRDK